MELISKLMAMLAITALVVALACTKASI
jgi:hypothetical protein